MSHDWSGFERLIYLLINRTLVLIFPVIFFINYANQSCVEWILIGLVYFVFICWVNKRGESDVVNKNYTTYLVSTVLVMIHFVCLFSCV